MDLDALSRHQLQQLCKVGRHMIPISLLFINSQRVEQEHNIKANLSSKELITLLQTHLSTRCAPSASPIAETTHVSMFLRLELDNLTQPSEHAQAERLPPTDPYRARPSQRKHRRSQYVLANPLDDHGQRAEVRAPLRLPLLLNRRRQLSSQRRRTRGTLSSAKFVNRKND